MAPPTVLTPVGVAAAGVGAITPALPVVTFQDGDVIIGVGESVADFPNAATNGFAHVTGSPQVQDTNTRLTVIWRRWTAGLTAHSWGDSGDHNLGAYIAIRGCKDTGNPWNVIGLGLDATLDNSALWPGYAAGTTVADCLVLEIGAWSDDFNVGALTNAGLASITERIDAITATGADGAVCVISGVKATAGAIAQSTATLTGVAFKAMMTLALEPAPATTSVSSDLDVRWSTLAQVSSDVDVRWATLSRVTSDLDVRWAVAAGPSLPVRSEVSGWSNTVALVLTTAADTQVGDLLVLVQADDYYTLAGLLTPTGTAASSWTEQTTARYDGGSLAPHAKVWTAPVTTGGAQTVNVNWTNLDHERYGQLLVIPGGAFDMADPAAQVSATTWTADAGIAADTYGLLIVAAGTDASGNTNFTFPGGMTALTERDASTFATFRTAYEQVGTGSTGTRLITLGTARAGWTVSVTIKPAGATTPVSSDLDVRWATLARVTSDLDVRWRTAARVSSDLDLRWAVLASSTPVSSDLDLRWRTLAQVVADADLRWAVVGATTSVSSDLSVRWATLARLVSDLDLRWRLSARLSSDLDVRWRTLVRLTSDADLRWRLYQSLTSDLDVRWRTLLQVQSDLGLRWAVLSSLLQVTSDLDLRWRLQARVASDLDVRWGVLATLSSTLDVRWLVRVPVTADLDVRWLVLQLAASTLELRWVVVSDAPPVIVPVTVTGVTRDTITVTAVRRLQLAEL